MATGTTREPGRRRAAGRRRVTEQGQDHLRLPRRRLHRRVVRRAHPGPAARRRRRARPSTRASRGPGSASTPRTASSRCTSISPEKKAQVAKLKSLLAGADELYLATDEDREGEAIAWHLLETLKPKVPVKRMVFHEITPAAIRAAAENPRALDDNLVDAQETRRILDRLYGYEVSPVLWKKVMPKLSAGRVQSVATRIIVQRERERMAFRSGHLLGSGRLHGPDRRRQRRPFKSVAGDRRRPPAGRRPRLRPGHRRDQGRHRRAAARRGRRPHAGRRSCRAARPPSARSRRSPTPASPTRRS